MQLSAAFIKGAQFAIGANQLAQDAKAKKDEEIHWRTIGEGEEARAVPIDGPDPKAKKAESKKAETKKPTSKKPTSKKAETKKAETKKAETKKPEAKKPEAKKAAEPKKTEGKAAQPRAEGNRGTETSRTSRKETALEKRIKDAISKKIPGTDKYTESNIKDALKKIGKHIPLFNESMDKIQEQISAKEKNGTFDRARVEAERRRRRAYMDAFAGYLAQANDTINNLDKTTNDEHQKDRGALINLALYTAKLTRDALLWRDDVHSVSMDLDNVTVWS